MNYVTLFDSGYLTRGLALLESLKRHCKNEYKVYVLAMDERAKEFFSEHRDDYMNVRVFSVSNIINQYPVLEKIEKERGHRAFCWTLSSFSIQFVMNTYSLDEVVYLDSDIFFYKDPEELLNEKGGASVLITEHNFWPERGEKMLENGKFCVQYIYFKNDNIGRKILEKWRQDCEKECGLDSQNGMFGDQKYLDKWEALYGDAVFVTPRLGAGVAVWNLQRFSVVDSNGSPFIIDRITDVKEPVFFYHFSQLRRINKKLWFLSNQPISDDYKKIIYQPYIELMNEIEKNYKLEDLYKEKKYSKVALTRFMPVPYTGEPSIECRFIENKEDEETKCVFIQSKKDDRQAEIVYRKSLHSGQWVIIDSQKNLNLFAEELHEIIWAIIYKECYVGMNMKNEIYFEILRRAKKGELMMLECPSEVLRGIEVKYPCISIAEVLRNTEDIISTSGATIFSDLVIYNDRMMEVE